MNIEEVINFYEKTWKEGQSILGLILDDKEQYIELKRQNPEWSQLTLEMANLNNQAHRLFSIMKYTFLNSTSHMLGAGEEE
tara:strand:- start:191 stop:433 length:243 start_codon:yes stop_codon:yes gene_type:complete